MNTMKFKIGNPVIYAGFGAGTSRPYAVAATIKKVEYSEKIGQYIYHAKGEDGQNYCDIESNIIFDDRSLNAEDRASRRSRRQHKHRPNHPDTMTTLKKIIKWAAGFEKMTEAPILNYLTIYEDKNGVTKSAFTYTNEQQLFKRLGIKDTQNIYDFLINKYGMKGLTLYYLLADIELPF